MQRALNSIFYDIFELFKLETWFYSYQELSKLQERTSSSKVEYVLRSENTFLKICQLQWLSDKSTDFRKLENI